MRRSRPRYFLLVSNVILVLMSAGAYAEDDTAAEGTGTVKGTVTLDTTGDPIHGAEVLIVSMGVSTYADSEGRFEFDRVPAGTQEILAVREHLIANSQLIEVKAGEVTEVNFSLTLTPIHESITVTASAKEMTTFDAFNSVTSLDSLDLVEKMAGSIGEVLEDEPGMYKRSFGPGSTRPIIRGFDGDRVLVMQDGIRTGDLSSQSGDHGVSIDPGGLERLEVVKGPSTLLYGSNAVGGVVNAITPHDTFLHDRHVGSNGQILTDFGSANTQAGVNGSFQHTEENWTVWGAGGARRSGDYDTPEGSIENSATRLSNARGGFGLLRSKAFFTVGYQVEDGRYGIPGVDELNGPEGGAEQLQVDIDTFRQSARFDAGMRQLETRFVESFRFIFNYLDWHHDEIEVIGGQDNLGTSFDNRTYVLRAEVEQKKVGRLSGRFGFWGMVRDYASIGEEALSPPTTQDSFAGFGYEEVQLGPSARLQLGGRVERNAYDPEPRAEPEEGHGVEGEAREALEPPETRPRQFTGLSGSVGLHYGFGEGYAFVANLTGATRAPALEELYNFGPHAGNLAFEIGNPDLQKETSLGVDLSLRSQASRVEGSINFFYYGIRNFVFSSFTGELADGLRVAEFLQGDSRFVGVDGEATFELHPFARLELDLGYVDAKLTQRSEYLPRIPPLHGRVGLQIPYKAFTLRPELVWAARQGRVSVNETPTAGYLVFNVNASYLLAKQDLAHIFSVQAYNLNNELYRLHTSFIKDFAPEMGRGIKFSYAVRFF